MGREVWFISDTHFGHENIIPYCRQQFGSVEEMEQAIVERWNEAIHPNDLVYHLGDFAWKPAEAIRVRPMLNGTIRLIIGNHDDVPALVKAGLFQRVELWRQFRDHHFTVSHIPLRFDQLRHSSMNLHGHVHGNLDGLEHFHRDMSVESTDFRPVHFDEIAAWASRTTDKQ